LLYKLQSKLPADDPRVGMDESDYFSFIRSGCADEESFLQEFMCQPADDNTAFLSYDLIAACEYQGSEEWETDLMDCKNPLYVGVDIGREHDLTVIWLVESVNGVHFTRRIVELDKQTFDAQECALYELLRLPMVHRCCIDRSGLGRQFAERAAKKFGPYRVEGIDFTQGSKEELAYPVRMAFEDRTVRVPFSNAIRADLRGVRKLVTSAGNTRFAGERNAHGHCDRFWALALALYAARRLVTGAITSVEGIKIGSLDVARRRQFIPRTLGQGMVQRYFGP